MKELVKILHWRGSDRGGGSGGSILAALCDLPIFIPVMLKDQLRIGPHGCRHSAVVDTPWRL